MNNKLWAGRFNSTTNPDVELYTASIHFDVTMAREDILGSMAHANMLQHCRIISSDEYTQLMQGLHEIALDIAQGNVQFSVDDEDIHMNIERLLTQRIGAVAGKLHTARSRNDQVALDLHLYLRQQMVTILESLQTLQTTLLQMAKRDQGIIMPGYTHLQRAQPIYLAKHWLAYVSMLQRDASRLQDCWARVNLSPLGACALAGTTFNTDPEYTATLLGFDGVYNNSLDAVSDRDFVIEFLAACSLIMLHLSRLSEELILWSSQEFNFISFDDAFCTGSSIMPQKKNPDVVELGRGKTGRVYGALISLLTMMKALPLAYNKDLQEDKEPLFDTIKTVQQTLRIYAPLLESLTVNTVAMQQAVTAGFLNATSLAEYLVMQGCTFRQAHAIAGKIVAYCIEKNCRIDELTLPEMQQFSMHLQYDIFRYLQPDVIVKSCSKKNQSLSYEINQCSIWIESSATWIAEKSDLLESVYQQFDLNTKNSPPL